jgi:dTDP-4-amino-4,6-dideoxygalactose transaminase
MDTGNFLMGEELSGFEGDLARWMGGGEVVGCGSGTDAVTLALMAGGIGRGDEVLVSSFVPGATVSAILATGAHPVLVDCGEDYGISLDALTGKDLSRVRAWVAVHLYGMMAPTFTAFLGEARARGWWVVEDCAQALGAELPLGSKVYRAGSGGDVGAFSFYPSKNLGAFGDAGACWVREGVDVVQRLRRLRQYGWEERDDAVEVGRNSRLDEVQAAVLRLGLRRLREWTDERRRLAGVYNGLFADIDFEGFRPWEWGAGAVYHQYVLRVEGRDEVEARMRARGIPVGVHYRRPAHVQRAFAGFERGGMTRSVRLASEVLSLPVYPGLTEGELERVACGLIEEMKR